MNPSLNRLSINGAAPFLLTLSLLCFSALATKAQESGPSAPSEAEQNAPAQGGDLIRALGLTPDQLIKIRMIREQHKEERRLAGERLQRAQRALDEAIYSDDGNEAVIEERARELAAAQAATIRLRAITELGIRRVLTPEQLGRLRELRRQQAMLRRLERQMNRQRRRRDNPSGDDDAVPALPRDRFRQRQNNPSRPNNSVSPINTPRERRVNPLRRARP